MKIKAVAIDDEPIALKVIENFCAELDYIELEKSFSDPKEGLDYLNNFPVDLLFLDIDMPFISGLELYKKLGQNTMVIFITAKAGYAVEGFELQAVDYLLKPFTFERFEKASKRALDFKNFNSASQSSDQSKFLFIRADFSLMKIQFTDICNIEALDDYLKIYVNGQKPVVARMTMKKMMEKLPQGQFVRVHRSHIVNVNEVKALKAKTISLKGKEIPIGDSYYQNVEDIFNRDEK